jgi:hypothetical protein
MLKSPFFAGLLTVAITAASFGAESNCSTGTVAVSNIGPVSGSATFTTGEGFITVTLTNLIANPLSAGQLLNALSFTLSSGETSGTLGNNSANLRTIQANGSFKDFGPSSTGWALANNVSGGLELCVLCTELGGAGPSRLLIGAPGPSGSYQNANRSIAANGPHNPFTTGIATFTLNVPGVTASTTATSSRFFFSTQSGAITTSGSCSPGLVLF